jgi:hypothetical protein
VQSRLPLVDDSVSKFTELDLLPRRELFRRQTRTSTSTFINLSPWFRALLPHYAYVISISTGCSTVWLSGVHRVTFLFNSDRGRKYSGLGVSQNRAPLIRATRFMPPVSRKRRRPQPVNAPSRSTIEQEIRLAIGINKSFSVGRFPPELVRIVSEYAVVQLWLGVTSLTTRRDANNLVVHNFFDGSTIGFWRLSLPDNTNYTVRDLQQYDGHLYLLTVIGSRPNRDAISIFCVQRPIDDLRVRTPPPPRVRRRGCPSRCPSTLARHDHDLELYHCGDRQHGFLLDSRVRVGNLWVLLVISDYKIELRRFNFCTQSWITTTSSHYDAQFIVALNKTDIAVAREIRNAPPLDRYPYEISFDCYDIVNGIKLPSLPTITLPFEQRQLTNDIRQDVLSYYTTHVFDGILYVIIGYKPEHLGWHLDCDITDVPESFTFVYALTLTNLVSERPAEQPAWRNLAIGLPFSDDRDCLFQRQFIGSTLFNWWPEGDGPTYEIPVASLRKLHSCINPVTSQSTFWGDDGNVRWFKAPPNRGRCRPIKDCASIMSMDL